MCQDSRILVRRTIKHIRLQKKSPTPIETNKNSLSNFGSTESHNFSNWLRICLDWLNIGSTFVAWAERCFCQVGFLIDRLSDLWQGRAVASYWWSDESSDGKTKRKVSITNRIIVVERNPSSLTFLSIGQARKESHRQTIFDDFVFSVFVIFFAFSLFDWKITFPWIRTRRNANENKYGDRKTLPVKTFDHCLAQDSQHPSAAIGQWFRRHTERTKRRRWNQRLNQSSFVGGKECSSSFTMSFFARIAHKRCSIEILFIQCDGRSTRRNNSISTKFQFEFANYDCRGETVDRFSLKISIQFCLVWIWNLLLSRLFVQPKENEAQTHRKKMIE